MSANLILAMSGTPARGQAGIAMNFATIRLEPRKNGGLSFRLARF
jgi:hypothetical protein